MEFAFDNDILRKALENFRADSSDENLVKAAQALVDTKIMIPAKWDKEPTTDEEGKMHFSPDTKVAPMVVTNENGVRLFPFFTSVEEVKKLYGEKGTNCVVMSMDQYMPMLLKAKKDITGVVVDPAGADVPFPTEFIQNFLKAYRSPLRQQEINSGQNLYLRNPEGDLQDMEAALISGGFHDPAIEAIYLKERLETDKPVEKPEDAKVHWFILVDAAEKDTGIFTRLSELIKPAAGGKDIEFMFADTKLGRDIKKTSQPIYTKMFH